MKRLFVIRRWVGGRGIPRVLEVVCYGPEKALLVGLGEKKALEHFEKMRDSDKASAEGGLVELICDGKTWARVDRRKRTTIVSKARR